MEYKRPEFSVLIWDINSAAVGDVVVERKLSGATVDSSYAIRPVVELCMKSLFICNIFMTKLFD